MPGLAAEGTRILLVEDNRTTARTISLFLEAEGYEVETVPDGRAALSSFRSAVHDLVVLDLMLPDVDGLTVCRSIRRQATTPIVILTARTTVDDIVAGLECGADDYVCKPFRSRELLARMKRCLQRGSDTPDDNKIFSIGAIELDSARRRVTVDDNHVKLTKSEYEILRVLMRRPGRVFTRDQLIDQALGPDFDGVDRTIDTHIWSLRKKLKEPPGKPNYLISELGVGYRMSEPDGETP